MDAKMLELYAEFAVKTAVNVQKGQTLIINSPVEAAFFARLCARVAFAAGARDVVVHYLDEQVTRTRMELADPEALEDIKPWLLRSYLDYAEGEGGVCRLAILAQDPEIFKGLDTAKIEKATQARMKAMKPWMEMQMSGRVQWSIVSVPTDAWALRVMGEMPAEQAREKLWEAIFKVCRVDGGDPVGAWRKHAERSKARTERLNAMALDALHLKSANGTDLVVGLADDYLFAGVVEESVPGGVPFLANVPTEEVFTAPHCRRVDGVVKSSMPFVYNGNLIEGITVTFKDGLAVAATAAKGQDLLEQLMSADEGAKRLGEIALVPASSPIRQTGLLFYNTLFDENAACHMAFGAAYPNCVKGGTELPREQLDKMGVNDSLVHEDIMIGTEDMEITGIGRDGGREKIFVGGEWAF